MAAKEVAVDTVFAAGVVMQDPVSFRPCPIL